MMWKYFFAWMPMVLIAIANGALRELWYRKHVGELHAHQISTVFAILLFAVYISAIVRIWPPRSPRHAFTVGLMWLGLTLAFEFLFGHYVSGLSPSDLLHDYNLLVGRIWVLIPIWITVAPSLFCRLRRQ
jgi:hypothetical protein